MTKKWMALTLALCLLFMAIPMAQAATRLDLDKYSVVRYDENQAVYSGPSKDYLRANNGKALLGAHGECRLYGTVGSWTLVGYQMTNGNYRIGYVPKSAEKTVVRKGSVGDLAFDMTLRAIIADCEITDDPVINYNPLGTLSAGTKVSLLQEMYEWAYVETTIGGKIARGFVQTMNVSDVSVPSSAATESASYVSGSLDGYVLPGFKTAKLGAYYAIFTGPGEDYYRAQGIAHVGRTTECRVYGREGEWALVAYKTSSGPYRYGYVPAAVIPESVRLADLNTAAVYATVKNKTALSEDPVTKKGTLTELSAGTQVVFISYLDSSRAWALVEVESSAVGLVRGYVRANQLNFN